MQGSFYSNLCRVCEEPAGPLSEADIQRYWFEECYKEPLRSTDGEDIFVLQPGFWNRGPGPDFHHASLINGSGEIETGAVEVHWTAPDWNRHRHDQDRGYEHVILHLAWEMDSRDFFPSTAGARRIRQVEFSSQLKAPLDRLREAFTALPLEIEAGARLGRCKSGFDDLSDSETLALLREAGWYRFHQRVRLWGLRREILGADQALWLGLSDALGYSRNRDPFRALAQRVRAKKIAGIKKPETREALLLGVASFLPERTLPESVAAKSWLRHVWGEWWRMRVDWDHAVIPNRRWDLSGLRPANRPERRVAVLGLLSDLRTWESFVKACAHGDPAIITRMLKSLSHEFWDCHFSIKGRKSPRRAALLGTDRIEAFLFNVVWPLAYEERRDEIAGRLESARTSASNEHSRRAAVRLLGHRRIPRLKGDLLAQEGLIQVYRDFCLEDHDHCVQCEFPQLVEGFRFA